MINNYTTYVISIRELKDLFIEEMNKNKESYSVIKKDEYELLYDWLVIQAFCDLTRTAGEMVNHYRNDDYMLVYKDLFSFLFPRDLSAKLSECRLKLKSGSESILKAMVCGDSMFVSKGIDNA